MQRLAAGVRLKSGLHDVEVFAKGCYQFVWKGLVAKSLEITPRPFEDRARAGKAQLCQFRGHHAILCGFAGTEAFGHDTFLDTFEQAARLAAGDTQCVDVLLDIQVE